MYFGAGWCDWPQGRSCNERGFGTLSRPIARRISGLKRLRDALVAKERALRAKFNGDISDPESRRYAQILFDWVDHGVLRALWHNFSEVAPGVYRSNHPEHKRFTAYKAKGIKTILNLRGENSEPPYLFEKESCDALGLTLVSVSLSARQAPVRERLLELITAFETIEKPFLIHCKSGADRTGLAGVLYLMIHEGEPVDKAMRQLSFRYLHIRRTSTGILDHFFDTYAARNAQSPIGIIDWIRDEYDRDALVESFAVKQANLKWWQGWR